METTKSKKMSKAGVVALDSASSRKNKKTKGARSNQELRVSDSSSQCITHEQIARRAWSIWRSKGCVSGQDEMNWCQAESELLMDMARD